MSRTIRLRTIAGPLVALMLLGCEGPEKGVEQCRRCERPPPPPQTVKVEVDWQKLAKALEGVGGDTIYVLPPNMTVPPADPEDPKIERPLQVAVKDWNNLIAALKSLATAGPSECADCGEPGSGHDHDQDVVQNHDHTFVHDIRHTTFDVRFTPPWFNADQRSLFTSYVVFPQEAQIDEWVPGEPAYDSCEGSDPSPAVCPDRTFHRQVMEPFLKALEQCAKGEEKVKLRTVGFASASRLRSPLEKEPQDTLDDRHTKHTRAVSETCLGESAEEEKLGRSAKFNLLIANQRAVHAAAMLSDFASELGLADAFDIDDVPWCSHKGMVEERGHAPGSGLINRRAEARLVDIPGCLNVDPDRRIDVTEPDPDAREAETPQPSDADGSEA